MKILYALQGTGNGHVSRAREILPYLKQFGEVDILISGTQAEVGLQYEIKYQFNGFGFVFGNKGGVDFGETWNRFHLKQFYDDVKIFRFISMIWLLMISSRFVHGVANCVENHQWR